MIEVCIRITFTSRGPKRGPMASVRLAECAPLPAPSQTLRDSIDCSITEVSLVLHDLSWRSSDGPQSDWHEKLENEVMVDPWSSMDSSNSPLTDSVPSASDDCTPSTSSEPPRSSQDPSPLSPEARRPIDSKHPKPPQTLPPRTDKARSRDLTLALDSDPLPRRHFLDDDYQNPSKSNIECRIPKPHFLDHSPSPDEFDERSDITNPNFLDDEAEDDQAQKKAGALPKKTTKTPTYLPQEERPHRTSYRSTLHYGLENAARSSERDKRASQLYRGTWPGERDIWTGHDSASVRSFSSNGSADGHRPSSNLDNKMDCVISLISLLSLSPENNADLSGPLLEMSRSVESCIAMRQAGCIPLLVQLIHSKVPRETRDRAAKALRNIIHTQTDDKAGRREARVWRLLEQVREYCYILEDVVENRKEGKDVIEDDGTKHPSQSVAALMKLSFDEEHRHVVCQLGGLQALAALVSGDQAAHGSRTDDNTCLTMRKYAGMTLTNLTFGDGNNKSLLCSFKEFMLALVEQLESPNDDMRQVTAAVLRNLSWRADTSSKQVLREVGAVKGLTKAAMTCQKEATLKSVLSALWNLTAHCSMNKVALCSVDGALGFLVDMLSYDSPTKTLAIVENAGGIMRNVSSHIAVREDYRQILRERNCLSVLLQHLKSPSLTVVSNSCGTLWNLSARCPQDQQFLWDHGAVPMLRSLIHSKHKMIAMGSGAALKNLLNSKPGKTHIISLDSTARTMNLPALPTLGARKQKALEQELDQNLAETCDNIEPATSPTTSNRDEKNLFTATERQIAMNLNRMSSSSPLMGALTSQISLSHSAHLASYLSCSNTLLKGALVTRSTTGSSTNVNRSDSKDSVTSAHSDTVFERVMRTGKVPVPTPRNKDLMKSETGGEAFKMTSKPLAKDGFLRYPTQPPIPPPRTTDMRTNYTESGYDVDQDSCDQPIDFSRKYSETKTNELDPSLAEGKPKATKKYKKDSPSTFGDYQETDLDQPTDYSLRYAEHQSENGSDISEPAGPSVHEDTIKHFATEGTPYETPIIFSTATSMSDLRVIGKDGKPKSTPSVKENPEVMTHSDEKDTCSIEDPPRHDNDRAIVTPQNPEPIPEKRSVFDTKFSSGMISPEKPVNYCDEGTPGYFSRVSSLSSLGEPTEEDSLAKKNAMATINVEPSVQDQSASSSKDKEGSKAVTFATDPVAGSSQPSTPGRFVEDTPLMFSRSSSLGSLPEADEQPDQGSVLSEVSRLTSGCISPSEIPDSPGAPASPRGADPASPPPVCEPELDTRDCREVSVFEERTSQFMVENTPAQCSPPNLSSLSSLTIEEEIKPSQLSLKLSSEAKGSKNDGNEHSPAPRALPVRTISEPLRVVSGTQTPGDTCQVYFTEDTPAILSKAGSNSNLSVLSIDSAPPRNAPDTSDSSNLSDADLLEDCIQKGIANVCTTRPCPVSSTEDTPAILSKAGSNSNLSVLSIDSAPPRNAPDTSDSSNLSDADLLEDCIQKGIANVCTTRPCPVSSTEDTPAILSKAGSNSNLSVLSIDSAPPRNAPDTSDSSNLSDADLLEDCIQKGIANVCTTRPCPVSSTEDTPAILSKAGSNSNLSVLSIDSAPPRNAPDTSDSSNLSDADLLEDCIQKGIANVCTTRPCPVSSTEDTPAILSKAGSNSNLSVLSIDSAPPRNAPDTSDSSNLSDADLLEDCIQKGIANVCTTRPCPVSSTEDTPAILSKAGSNSNLSVLSIDSAPPRNAPDTSDSSNLSDADLLEDCIQKGIANVCTTRPCPVSSTEDTPAILSKAGSNSNLSVLSIDSAPPRNAPDTSDSSNLSDADLLEDCIQKGIANVCTTRPCPVSSTEDTPAILSKAGSNSNLSVLSIDSAPPRNAPDTSDSSNLSDADLLEDCIQKGIANVCTTRPCPVSSTEDTPAILSKAGSNSNLSVLSIDSAPPRNAPDTSDSSNLSDADLLEDCIQKGIANVCTTRPCPVSSTEDTPAILSKAGSNSNLSVLSIDSAPPRNAPDTSDSSNLSDADLLEDCIQKGIANVCTTRPCPVSSTEDTPAILSKAGSNSNLSVLSIDSAPPRNAPDTSDSSNLSDADLLEDCIQKGIANVCTTRPCPVSSTEDTPAILSKAGSNSNLSVLSIDSAPPRNAPDTSDSSNLSDADLLEDCIQKGIANVCTTRPCPVSSTEDTPAILSKAGSNSNLSVLSIDSAPPRNAPDTSDSSNLSDADLLEDCIQKGIANVCTTRPCPVSSTEDTPAILSKAGSNSNLSVLSIDSAPPRNAPDTSDSSNLSDADLLEDCIQKGIANVCTTRPCPVSSTEDTPAILSKAGSNSNLSVLSIDSAPPRNAPDTSDSSNLSDADLLEDCIQKGIANVCTTRPCPVSSTEDTPAILSKAGSNSNLSVLSIDSAPPRNAPDTSDSSNLSDADLLEDCIQKGIANVCTTRPCPVSSTEDTPAILSKAGSNSNLSVLSIDSAPPRNAPDTSDSSNLSDADLLEDCIQKGIANVCTTRPCPVSSTEDTPAILSKAGSNSNLSVLSIDSAPPRNAPDTSDSSNLSDADLLEDCIQKGIANVVKNKPSKDLSSVNYSDRDNVYRSLPPYLRTSTETVKMSHEHERNVRVSPSPSSSPPAPPLPPKDSHHAAPPRPPRALAAHAPPAHTERRRESRLPIKTARNLEKPQLPAATHDSSSSLSLDSFGSTDREIFEETVQAGLSHARHFDKAHSVERPTENVRHTRHHKSLDRSDKISQHRPKVKDEEFERNLASGVYNIKSSSRVRRLEQEFALTRSPYSYHGESSSMAHRFRGHHSRYYDDGPPSLPARIDEPRKQLERSNSLSSLSNDSFGSTDKEVFERCVRMGMSKAQPKRSEKLRVRSDDRSERRRRRDNKSQGALDRMVGEDSLDRALLEEVIARGAGEGKAAKNVCAPSAAARAAGGAAPSATRTPGSEDPLVTSLPSLAPSLDTSRGPLASTITSDSLNRSNECLAPQSANTTLDSEVRDELNRSNESYADVLDGSWSDEPRNYEVATLTRKKLEYTDIKYTERAFEESQHDTWNDNTCPDDVTFPTISGSVHMVSSIRSEIADAALALPDLLEKSEPVMSTRPDLTNKLDEDTVASELQITEDNQLSDVMLDNIPEPSYTSLVDDGEQKFDSLMASAIEKEAARLAAQLKSSTYGMENSVTSLTSLDLDNVKPPSHLGSLLSLSASGQWDDTSKKSQKSRKKSLPVAMMVKRALSNSMHQGSSEHLDSNPVSFLDNVKPPSEMENLDMESSMVSVSSIVSEVADREKTPVIFDFKQPIQDFPLCHNFNLLDLDKVNPPSLFDEMAESTVEIEPTTAHQLHDEASSTLNVVTDIPSGSENCTPLPSDMSSVESTPKKTRDPKYLTPKEKRNVAKDRYQTYTIIDPPSESDVLTVASEEFMTWTKSESDRSDDYVTANSESKSKRKMSAKQRRLEDRARYQTQTVNIQSIIQETKAVDPQIESLKQRLAAKKTMKQKRMEDAERFRTRTLSEDIPPSPTFVTKDASFENVETTTGYDSLSSNELNHQQIIDDRHDDVFRETDSGHNEDDFELNSTQMQTYTKSFRNYLPVIESPAAVDICVVNNLKNIEMTASYRRALQSDKVQNPSSSDFASYEGDTHSDNDSEEETAPRPKPKITKPERRDESLDSNESHEKEEPKAVRGRKKAAYVSPYRRSVPPAKKPATTPAKAPVKAIVPPKSSAKAPSRTPTTSKPPSANTSPKKTLNKSPSKVAQKAVPVPLVAGKPLPLERQGTFTKEESSVPAKDLPVPVAEKKPIVSRYAKSTPKPAVNNTSPSRLPQLNRYSKPPLKKGGSSEKPAPKPKPAMRNSASNHSLQSNDSAKTVTLASRGSRQGSTSSVNSVQSSKINSKDVESKIASLWKKVEQTKKVIAKPDKRVWIESDKSEQPKLIRSSTFEGQPKQAQVSTAPKQKTAIGIKVSQIPSLRPKSTPSKITAPSVKKPVTTRVFTRKPANGQVP
ncbi:adenomatous polyposis coli protein-like isoform X3 [Cydia pomonella]|uniref:adenomatous polyposis coli protein-like isoform X3 n=2 Tax=Cydia pomonella TaxID=82600 RepID=UPI002ADE801F|nr:adenomatous polyposis coli protein-like isoform X3 [Cydia pomonella]